MTLSEKMHRAHTQALTLSCALGLLLGLAACDQAEDVPVFPAPDANLLEAIQTSPGTTVMEEAVEASGLGTTLSSSGPYTVFSVLDEGFDDYDVEALLAAPETLATILQYHVVDGIVTPEELTDGATLTSLAGEELFVNVNGNEILVNGATVTAQLDLQGNVQPIEVTNGVIYPINRLLFPDLVLQTTYREDLTVLELALMETGLLDDLQGTATATVFAPTDAVFSDLFVGFGGELPENDDDLARLVVDLLLERLGPDGLAKVLTYHVSPDERINVWDLADGTTTFGTLAAQEIQVQADVDTVTVGIVERFSVTMDVNDVPVANANYLTPDGVLHLLDGLLLQNLNLAERLLITPEAEVLTEALVEAGRDMMLAGGEPLTVFAPSDAGFEGIDTEELLADPTLLGRVLDYHIVRGAIRTGDLTDGMMLTTLGGEELNVEVDADGEVLINEVPIEDADIEAENGVIQLVGEVFQPPSFNLVERLRLNLQTDVLAEAIAAAGLADDLSEPGPFTVFAPADDAARIDSLLELVETGDDEALRRILRYHVVEGEITAEEIQDNETVRTLQGSELRFLVEDDEVTIIGAKNRADITATNIMAANGIIHLIDEVLLPPPSPITVSSN